MSSSRGPCWVSKQATHLDGNCEMTLYSANDESHLPIVEPLFRRHWLKRNKALDPQEVIRLRFVSSRNQWVHALAYNAYDKHQDRICRTRFWRVYENIASFIILHPSASCILHGFAKIMCSHETIQVLSSGRCQRSIAALTSGSISRPVPCANVAFKFLALLPEVKSTFERLTTLATCNDRFLRELHPA